MEAALALEKHVNEALLALHTTAGNHNDAQVILLVLTLNYANGENPQIRNNLRNCRMILQ